jgi:hypothetical protein
VAIVTLTLKGEVLATLTVFGDEGSEPQLGVVSLEEFGLGIDPVNKTLVAVTLLLVATREIYYGTYPRYPGDPGRSFR